MPFDAESSFSRLPAGVRFRAPKTPPRPTRAQRALEITLFVVFGVTITLAGVALYATNRPEHQYVPNRVAQGLGADRVNVLLIGSSLRTRGGGSSDVDIESLMLISIQPSTGRAAVVSLPVDLWVKVGRFGQRRLRTTHMVGDASGYPGAGAGLTVETVEDIVKQPVHAYVRIGVGDIQRILQSVGGVDVEIQRNAYDGHCRKRYRAGIHHFNGAQAVHYAYSRDLPAGPPARSSRDDRQQEVVLAGLRKLLREEHDLQKITPLFGSLTATNLNRAEMRRLTALLRHNGGEIRRISFAPYLDQVRVNSVAYRGEAVRPRGGDFRALQKIVAAALPVG